MLKRFLDQLNEDLKLQQPLAPNEDGSYSLSLEPEISLILRETSDENVIISSELAPLPEKKIEDFLFRAMTANLFGRETGGSALGLNREGTKLVLIHVLPSQVNYREFHDRVEDFLNYAEAWRKEAIEFSEQTKE